MLHFTTFYLSLSSDVVKMVIHVIYNMLYLLTLCFNCLFRSDMVKISMDTFVKRFQPDRYELWLAGKDIGPHPEDPTRTSAANQPSMSDILCNKK